MAIQESLATRRDEAFSRIEQVVGRLATPHSIKHGALLNIRHDDPEVAAVMRVESLAKILGDVADAQDRQRTAAKATPVPVEAVAQEAPVEAKAKG